MVLASSAHGSAEGPVQNVRSETVLKYRAVLYARSETVQNAREKKLFCFSFFQGKIFFGFVLDQNKAFLKVSQKSVEKSGVRY
jgi:hypothetical protein